MHVSENHGSAVAPQCLLHDFARIHRGPVDRAAEELDELYQAMAIVKKEHAEGFELACTELERKKLTGGPGRRKAGAAPDAGRKVLSSRVNDFLCRGRNRITACVEREECLGVRHVAL